VASKQARGDCQLSADEPEINAQASKSRSSWTNDSIDRMGHPRGTLDPLWPRNPMAPIMEDVHLSGESPDGLSSVPLIPVGGPTMRNIVNRLSSYHSPASVTYSRLCPLVTGRRVYPHDHRNRLMSRLQWRVERAFHSSATSTDSRSDAPTGVWLTPASRVRIDGEHRESNKLPCS
jgi:hypothetical protein